MPDLLGIDLGRALWAVVFSLAMWVVVQAEVNPDRVDTLQLLVEARNVPAELVVTNQANWPPVQVRISAPRGLIGELRENQFRAYVDLAQAGRTGELREEEFPVQIETPDPQVRVGDPTPRRIRVRLEELGTRSLPVRSRADSSPPFGYRAGRAEFSPPSVLVRGPLSFLRRLDSAEVELRLDQATSDVNSLLPVTLVDTDGERVSTRVPGVEVQPALVRVTVPITQQLGYKEVGVRPQVRGAVPVGYWVQSVAVDPPVVPVVGDPPALAQVNAVDTDPVDLTGLTGSFNQPVNVQLPAGVTLVRADPVTLNVQIAPLTLTQTLRVPVIVANLGPDLFLAGDVPIVEVVASGPSMQGLSAAEVQARVDAAGLEAGTYALPVQVSLPPSYTLESVQPAVATVSLSSVGVAGATPLPPTPTRVPTPTPGADGGEPPAAPLTVATAPPPPPTATAIAAATRSPTPTAARTATPSPTPTATPRSSAAGR